MAMTWSSHEVGVVMRRRSIDNPWIDRGYGWNRRTC